jgi:hypothetical protein
MEAPFHMKLFEIFLARIGGFLHLKASIHWNFQTNKYYKGASVGIRGRWTNLFHPLFLDIKVEELPQWACLHTIIPKIYILWMFFHMMHILMIRGTKYLNKLWIRFSWQWFSVALWQWQHLAKVGWLFIKEVMALDLPY